MLDIPLRRGAARRNRGMALSSGTGVVAAMALGGMVGVALARDNSNAQLFSAGQGAGAAPALTIRVNHRKREAGPVRGRQRLAARGKSLPGPAVVHPGAVSLFEDATLRAGDVVMTPQGLRVFLGSRNFPYRPADFTTIAASRVLHGGILKTLSEIDRNTPQRRPL